MKSTPLHKAVFFDRDGTINSDEGHYYIYKPEDFVFNPGVVEGMKRLQDAGYLLFVITNQGGVAKGIYTCDDVDRVHAYMRSELAKQGIQLTNVQACECRKPSPYLVNLAVEEFHIDRRQSWFIGDSRRDVECAEAAGVTPILIRKNQDITPAIEQILSL